MMRQFIKIVESMYDDDEESHGSFGWWIYPNGSIDEMQEMGSHGITANAWLSDNDPSYQSDDDFDEAIDALLKKGAVRVSTFHGSDSMHLDFLSDITPAARNTLLTLLKDTRSDFSEYFFGDAMVHPVTYRQAVALIRKS